MFILCSPSIEFCAVNAIWINDPRPAAHVPHKNKQAAPLSPGIRYGQQIMPPTRSKHIGWRLKFMGKALGHGHRTAQPQMPSPRATRQA